MTGQRPAHLSNPRSHAVYLDGGPRHRQWWPYRDWLRARADSRREGYPLDHSWGSARCYLPTDQVTVNTDPRYVLRIGQARVWQYIPPAQWARWGREYRTPEEPALPHGERGMSTTKLLRHRWQRHDAYNSTCSQCGTRAQKRPSPYGRRWFTEWCLPDGTYVNNYDGQPPPPCREAAYRTRKAQS